MAGLVSHARAAAPPAEPTRIVLRPRAVDESGFTLTVEDGRYVVRGEKPERWVRQTDFSNDEAVGYLSDRLARLGVEDALREAGAERGDEIVVGGLGGVVFDWEPTLDRRGRAPGVRPARQRPAARGALRRVRAAVRSAQRIVVKVGSSSVTSSGGGIDADAVDALVDALVQCPPPGAQVVLVSSGAIAAGLPPLGLRTRPRDLATQQAAASVGQGLLVHRYTEAFARHGRTVGQVLLTADDLVRRTHYRNALRTLDKLLAVGAVPVVNENDTVATEEIRFGDNDRLAGLVAHLVRADLLVLLSDVDGLYDGDPRRPGTTLVTDVHGPDDLARVDLGGSVGRVQPASAPAGCRPRWTPPGWRRRRASRRS